ncbi:uncharacterized protein TNCV_124161 [Trichonephila clavipes]|nr:uncharacterized protein TNCV_124161 [Trichonephila clavipes]
MTDEFSETSPLEKEKSVKGYASKVFKESSVSAVSAIVSTGNTPRKVFRILVFVLFTAGFLYQCIKFLTYILTYPTVVNIEIDIPDEYLAPAYTFCNYNRIKRSKFCSKYPNSCSNPNKELCNTYPDYCRDNTTKVPKEDSIENLSMGDAMDLGHDSKNLLIQGTWEDPEGPFLRLNAEEQVPVACYSLGVRVDDPRDARYKKKDGWEVKDDEFVFDAEENEIFYPDSKPGVLFALHSPFDAVDPFEEGLFMKPGHLYRIKLQMMREELLPPPYKTDCLNYTEDWLKAGRTGPRSQEMCRHRCAQDFSENCFNCTFMEILYPKKITICEKTLDDLVEKGCSSGNNYENAVFLESCFKNCKDDCSCGGSSANRAERASLAPILQASSSNRGIDIVLIGVSCFRSYEMNRNTIIRNRYKNTDCISILRLPPHQITPIHSITNLSDRPGFGFVISRSNKARFASRIHTNRNRFNPPSF